MKGETVVEYASGHRCVDNGVGDFNMICPTHGEVPSFIPYMWAFSVASSKSCPLCGMVIGTTSQQP